MEWIWVLITVVVALLGWQIISPKNKRNIPGPKGWPILGNMPEAVYNRQRFLDWMVDLRNKYGDTVLLNLAGRQCVCVFSPQGCEHFMKTNFNNYIKGPERASQLNELLGNGIFVENGNTWKLHRKVAKPLFRTQYLNEAMLPVMISHGKELIHNLLNAKGPVDLLQEFMQYTMSTWLELGLGSQNLMTKEEKIKFAQAFDYCQVEITMRGTISPYWKYFITKKFKDSIKHIDDVVYTTIAQRKRESPAELATKVDIVSKFLTSVDDDGKPFSDKYVRDVFMNFLLAGRDTTAALLTWTFFLLIKNPDIYKKVLDEVNRVVKGDAPTPEEVDKLKYLTQVLTEVLRLYPSVPVDGREAAGDDVMPDGTQVKANDEIFYCAYAMGRVLWDDPMKFDPERWTDDKIAQYHPFLNVSFHGGPQTCLGQPMAHLEAKTAVAMIIKQMSFSYATPNQTDVPIRSIILIPKQGLKVNVHPR